MSSLMIPTFRTWSLKQLQLPQADLLDRLAPGFKTIADFRKDNTKAIKLICREFIICRKLNIFSEAFVTIGGSKSNLTTTVTGITPTLN